MLSRSLCSSANFTRLQVFHELARHLQTRRLLAGDTLNLDQDKSFYIVVDGSVQVFAQTGSPSKARDAYDDEDDNGYQLLNDVESGGTLSSLFTILSLFTEDVKLRYEEDHLHERDPDVSSFNLDSDFRAHSHSHPPPVAPHRSTPNRQRHTSRSPARPPSSASFTSSSTTQPESDATDSANETETGDESPSPRRRPLDPITSAPGTPGFGGSYQEHPREHEGSQKEGTIARASVDTTLAVIPAEAFRRLTKKFPNAAACILFICCVKIGANLTSLQTHRSRFVSVWRRRAALTRPPFRSHPHSPPTCHLPHGAQVPRPHA